MRFENLPQYSGMEKKGRDGSWNEKSCTVGNEIADARAEHGAAQPSDSLARLTYLELYSPYRRNDLSNIPPIHRLYQGKRTAGSLSLRCNRQKHSSITRFRSGHLRKNFFDLC
ncbi:hypothetical protein TNCV_4921201 [Trichonephila clavipes]|nr:hypothetical protein TNCV_4921201 [Trichonephila clavipes]